MNKAHEIIEGHRQVIILDNKDVLIIKEVLEDRLSIAVYTDVAPVVVDLSLQQVRYLLNHLSLWEMSHGLREER